MRGVQEDDLASSTLEDVLVEEHECLGDAG